ncbi:putative toxin-antitoxin system toxin component, PIN family [Candidatus Gottesmanbacteria bacterium]|nr:putative toxin-antitoxin system toxin component, PIN family [Candidatus Gottesmanbacteria bacterium]
MGPQKFKVVFDANIYLSFFLTSGETIAAIFEAWQNNIFEVYASSEIITEIKRVFFYPKLQKYLTKNDRNKMLLLLDRIVKKIYPSEKIEFIRDPEDAIYLEAAQACKADYLVSGDKDLLDLKKIGKTLIISPKEFLVVIIIREK